MNNSLSLMINMSFIYLLFFLCNCTCMLNKTCLCLCLCLILHLFIICNDLWCQLPFFSQTFRQNGSAVFGTMPPMCRSCPDVNKLRGMDSTILGQHRPFMSIKSFVQHSEWQEMVSLCSLIRLIGVCADRDKPEFLCSRSDSGYSKSMWPQGEAG